MQPKFYSDIWIEGRVCETFCRPLQSKYHARHRNSQAGPRVLPQHELPIDDYAVILATHMLTCKDLESSASDEEPKLWKQVDVIE